MRRWKAALKAELDVGYAARRLYERLGDGQLNFLMDMVGRTRLHRDLVSLPATDFDWHSGAVTKLLGHPLVGGFLRLLHPLGARLVKYSVAREAQEPLPTWPARAGSLADRSYLFRLSSPAGANIRSGPLSSASTWTELATL